MNSKYKNLIVETESDDFLSEGRKFSEQELQDLGNKFAAKSTYSAKQIPGLTGLKDGWGEKVKGEAALKKYNSLVQDYETLRKQLVSKAVPDSANSKAKKTMKMLSNQIGKALADVNKYAKAGKKNTAGENPRDAAERKASDKAFDKDQKTRKQVKKGFEKIRKDSFKDKAKRNVELKNKAKAAAVAKRQEEYDKARANDGKYHVKATVEDDPKFKK